MSRLQVLVPGNGLQEQFTSGSIPVSVNNNDIAPRIDHYSLRTGAPYLSPPNVVNYEPGMKGVPWWMAAYQVGQCDTHIYSAPQPQVRDIRLLPAKTVPSNKVAAFGAAPTKGIYTGLPLSHVEEGS